MRLPRVFYCLVITVVFLSACGERPSAPADGERIFRRMCAVCHGPDGKGRAEIARAFQRAPARMDLTDAETRAKSAGEIRQTILAGRAPMPPFAGALSESELAAVVDYVRSLAATGDNEPPSGPHE